MMNGLGERKKKECENFIQGGRSSRMTRIFDLVPCQFKGGGTEKGGLYWARKTGPFCAPNAGGFGVIGLCTKWAWFLTP